IQLGIKNFSHNGLLGDFTQGMISNNDLNLERFIKEKNIEYVDLLHSDIQGFEFEMLSQIKNYLENYKIKYLFISTHSNKIHYDCIKFLKRMKYKILCSSDFENETFHYDGFILACPEVINEIKEFKIGNRSKSKLISDKLLKQIINQ
ncbi:MAG: FkbM family methyltransferase, partial [Candidatus Fonsibacter ubiquis]